MKTDHRLPISWPSRRCGGLIVAFGLFVSPGAATALGESPTELLADLAKKRAKVETIHHITKTVEKGPKLTREITIELWEKRAGKELKRRQSKKAKTKVKDAKETLGASLIVSDGRSQWVESKLEGSVFVVKGSAVTQTPLEEFRESLRISRGQVKKRYRETVDGHRCWRFEIAGGKNMPHSRQSVWITEKHGILIKRQVVREGGQRLDMTTVKLRINTPLDDALFTYTPPAKATIIDTEAIGNSPAKPSKR